MNILEQIDESVRELKVTSFDVSFNELADMYQEGELIITPDYQRTFRWDTIKQSRFIETLLLEMPVPPVYAIEIDNGKYELIDGLQRISSYLSFRGMLKEIPEELLNDECADVDIDIDNQYDEEDPSIAQNGFHLDGCDIVPSLNGMAYDDLPASLKIKAKRAFITLKVLRKGINPQMKYHMFKRLNTGGEKLSYQEIRNCTIRLIDETFINFINATAKNKAFLATISNVSKSQKQKKFAEELVLRFFAFKNNDIEFSHDIDKFLTGYMEKVALADAGNEPIFNYDAEVEIFNNTFKWLQESMSNDAFAVYKRASDRLSGFNVYQYEAITIGIQSIYNKLESGQMSLTELKNKLLIAKHDVRLIKSTIGGGKNSPGLYQERVSRIKEILGGTND